VVQHPPSRNKALSSNPRIPKRKKRCVNVQKYTRRCSSSLMIREKQINTTIKFPSYLLRDHYISKTQKITNVGEDMG
jgi:hypothetical protein